MIELLLSVLFVDDVGVGSERIGQLHEVFDRKKQIIEVHRV